MAKSIWPPKRSSAVRQSCEHKQQVTRLDDNESVIGGLPIVIGAKRLALPYLFFKYRSYSCPSQPEGANLCRRVTDGLWPLPQYLLR